MSLEDAIAHFAGEEPRDVRFWQREEEGSDARLSLKTKLKLWVERVTEGEKG